MATVAQLKQGALFADRFRVERCVGRGGMGAVYEVVDMTNGERVALKVLAPQLVSDEKHRARFERESTIGNAIHSPHVVRVLEAGIDDDSETPWLTMELLRGEPLKNFVKAHRRLDFARAAEVLGQVGQALGAAHAAGVIHRDLKPDNVFIIRDESAGIRVKILDFGIAKLAADAGTRTTNVLGSPLWMPPEEAQKAPLSPASDIWSFGLLTFYVLTGHKLWRAGDDEDGNLAQALYEVLIEPIPNPVFRAAKWGVILPEGFGDWFGRTVVREPRARFQTAEEATSSLLAMLALPLPEGTIPIPPESLPSASSGMSGSYPSASQSYSFPPGSGNFPPGTGGFPLSASSSFSSASTSLPAPAAPAKPNTTSWYVGAAAIGIAMVLLIVAGTMVSRALQDPSPAASAASPTPSAVVPPPPPTELTPPPTASAVVDAGDPVLAAVEKCFSKDDMGCARSALEATVFAKTATTYQAQLLYDLCEMQKDAVCQKEIAKLYPTLDKSPKRVRTVVDPNARDPNESVFREAMKYSYDDPPRAKALLIPRVQSRKANQNEVALLATICGATHDAECRQLIDEKYPGNNVPLPKK